MTLYEMNQSWQEVFQMLLDPEIPEEAVLDSLEAIEATMDDKADGYAKIIRSFSAPAAWAGNTKLPICTAWTARTGK